MRKPLRITEVALRDAHQSLLATRLRIDDMLPVAEALDQAGYWSLETWGGATFDACIRYLGEDPWERLRILHGAMPRTPQQMLLRGQNLLGYRHYADDVVRAFVDRAVANGMDVFRIFDALNDVRNLKTAIRATLAAGKHAQGTLSYTTSPVHDIDTWTDLARQLEDLGCQSLCIKDMAGLLTPYEADALVRRLKKTVSIPLHLHAHATTGLSTATILKGVEAGLDGVDTAISSLSMTYGHSATEAVSAIFAGTDRAPELDADRLQTVALHFREVRKKYAAFEGSLRGVDARILRAQVPGGMLTNLESQLRQQNALDRFDEVIAEIPRVRQDLGFIPLVTPTSQIVGTQAVLNVLGGTYKTLTAETSAILSGEYGRTPAPVNEELRQRVLGPSGQARTDRPADHLAPEMDRLQREVEDLARTKGIELGRHPLDDALTLALFPREGARFLEHRGHPEAFEPAPGTARPAAPETAAENQRGTPPAPRSAERYRVSVNGVAYEVEVGPTDVGIVSRGAPTAVEVASPPKAAPRGQRQILAPLAGTIVRVLVKPGQRVAKGDDLVHLEAMKMETPVRAPSAGLVVGIDVSVGNAVAAKAPLLSLAEVGDAAAAP